MTNHSGTWMGAIPITGDFDSAEAFAESMAEMAAEIQPIIEAHGFRVPDGSDVAGAIEIVECIAASLETSRRLHAMRVSEHARNQ